MVDTRQRTEADSLDAVALVRERQEPRIALLAEQLDRALDALLAARLRETSSDLDALRRALFDLYEERIVTKAQVRARGRLAPDEFHEHLRAHRRRVGPELE